LNTEIIKKEVLSSDGVHTLKGVIYLPASAPKGIFHIVHGMTEYIGRYDALLSLIASAGYVACGFDNLGHGKTAGENEFGFIAEKDGYKYLIDDVMRFGDAVKKDYPGIPYYLVSLFLGSLDNLGGLFISLCKNGFAFFLSLGQTFLVEPVSQFLELVIHIL
jgi:alpha-beta hydrolase superfamily lysophospholipase